MEPARTATPVLDLINGCWTTQAICAGVELGVFDALAAQADTATDLAQRLGTDTDATARLLRALTTLGLCTACERGVYRVTGRGEVLCARHPENLQGWALLAGRTLWEPWKGLADSVRTGHSYHRRCGQADRFGRLDTDDEEARIFQRAMTASTRALLPALIPALAGVLERHGGRNGVVADVGSGHGELLAGILDALPGWAGIAFDLAYARPFVERTLRVCNLSARARFEEGSFFASVPTADALLLKSVLHDWDDEHVSGILRCCRGSLRTDGVLVVVERTMPQEAVDCVEHRRLARADLNMLVGPGGRERSLREFEALLCASGLRLVGHQSVAAGFDILVGSQ